MDKPISVGDLVMQVKECCPEGKVGRIYRVARIYAPPILCPKCGYGDGREMSKAFIGNSGSSGTILKWLKRIPGPEELGIVDEREELTA